MGYVLLFFHSRYFCGKLSQSILFYGCLVHARCGNQRIKLSKVVTVLSIHRCLFRVSNEIAKCLFRILKLMVSSKITSLHPQTLRPWNRKIQKLEKKNEIQHFITKLWNITGRDVAKRFFSSGAGVGWTFGLSRLLEIQQDITFWHSVGTQNRTHVSKSATFTWSALSNGPRPRRGLRAG